MQRDVFSLLARAFEALQNQLEQPDLANETTKNILKINLIGILYFIIQNQMNAFIEFIKFSQDSQLLLNGFIQNLFTGDQGLQIQITELLKFMTDSTHEKRNEMLDLFYDVLLPTFLEHYEKMTNDEKFFSFVQQYIEILIHCVKNHGYRIRHYIIQHKLLHSLYKGFHIKDKSLNLAIVRLVKNIILNKDEFLLKYIANNNLLDDIFDVYVKNSKKDNLLSSACLELFNIIHKEKIKKLIYHFAPRFRERISEFGLTNTFQMLFLDYEEVNDRMLAEGSFDLSESQQENNGALV